METELQELAQLYGVQTAYEAATGENRIADPASLLRVLQIMGAPIARAADVADALRQRREAMWQRALEPVTLAWDGGPSDVTVRLPSTGAERSIGGTLALEAGNDRSLKWDLRIFLAAEAATLGGVRYVAKRIPLPGPLPIGYHRLSMELDGRTFESLVVSAPRAAYALPAGQSGRTWGVFLPLYALRTAHSWGSGDFSDLRRLLEWVHTQGGGVVATLPLLAAFLDEPCEPSPYSPASRLFWNEFYLDVAAIPELKRCPAAQALLRDPEWLQERAALRSEPLVDYPREMRLKRRVLEEMAQTFFAESDDRRRAFEQYLVDQPRAEDYARFRATAERLRVPWSQWPARLRDGELKPGDYAEEVRRYHLYVQWSAEEQLRGLAVQARAGGPGLYLDLPLGVHGDGYDVWRERDAFALEASGGAPPDIVFPRGQDWGFPPLHPERIRENGYRYVLAYLRRQVQYAGILRIDHMPVFHRLFWVPRGMDARSGVYVRYPAEELYALFSLESHRNRTMLVGEDLGTVPPEVPESMARHNFHGMFVVQYAVQPDPEAALPPIPARSVASVNTHDMPPFRTFWEGRDIAQRENLGLLGDQDPDQERSGRQAMVDALQAFLRDSGQLGDEPADARAALSACLEYLAASEARVALVNLEDLWLETESQNIPTTGGECANWRKKARYSLEQIRALPEVAAILRLVDERIRTGQPLKQHPFEAPTTPGHSG